MAKNMAQRRCQKAARRKAVLAERRRIAVLDMSLPARIRRAAAGPFRHCLLQEGLFESGVARLVVVRGAPGETMLCSFLLDAFCLGVKDVDAQAVIPDEAAQVIEAMSDDAPFRAVRPAYACKLMRDLIAWAGSIGFPPPPLLAAAQQIFGGVNPDSCADVFTFGRAGRPTYVPGPADTLAMTNDRLRQLRERLGKDGFDFMVMMPSGLRLEVELADDEMDDVFDIQAAAQRGMASAPSRHSA